MALAPIVIPFAVFGILEPFFPAHRLKSAEGWIFNIKVALLYQAVPVLFGAAIAGVVLLVRRHNGGGLLDLTSRDGSAFPAAAGICLLSLLIWDFFYYWWHRAQHEWKPLWAMHKLHHMDETLGVSTQLRCHWLEEIGRTPFIFVPMALLFNMPMLGGMVAIILTAWTAFIHANLRLNLGNASMIVAGPQVHRIHHSRLPEHFDKNYAALFPFYDVLFGTYHHPSRDEYPPTGVKDSPEISSLTQAFLLPFQSWGEGIRKRREAR